MSPKTTFIYGPPGTGLEGKTTYLASRVGAIVAEYGADSIVIASLTRAAAAEIAGRDSGVDPDSVRTLHSHALRACDRPTLAETPEGIKLWNAAHPGATLGTGGARYEDDAGSATGGALGSDVHAQVMNLRAAMVPRSAWTVAQLDHDAAWTDWKTQTGRRDFTDLIQECIDDGGPHYQLPRVLIADEAQDFSALELKLVETWGAHAHTTVWASDPDQCVYSWRGASVSGLADLAARADEVTELQQSYRVPRAVHALARTWIRRIADRHDVPYHPTDEEGEVLSTAVRIGQPDQLADLAREYAADGTVMVLASCGYMLDGLLHELRSRGEPFANPYAPDRGNWNPMKGTGRLKAFLAADERVWGAEARMWTWEDLRRWTEPLQARGTLVRGAKALIEAKCTENRFHETRGLDAVPMETLCELLGVSDLQHPAFHMDVDWWASRLRAAEAKKAEYAVDVWRKQGARALGEEPKLLTGTVHSVKGGEAETVIVCPDLSNVGYAGWREGGVAADALVRLLYVAISRARKRLVLLAPSAMGGEHVHRDLQDALEDSRAVMA